jgi:hypothetical protein
MILYGTEISAKLCSAINRLFLQRGTVMMSDLESGNRVTDSTMLTDRRLTNFQLSGQRRQGKSLWGWVY